MKIFNVTYLDNVNIFLYCLLFFLHDGNGSIEVKDHGRDKKNHDVLVIN